MHSGHTGLYVVMGVSGAGKSVIGRPFAEALALDFVEGDDYHPSENVRKMSSGIPLTDEDRAGWLQALAERIREAKDAGTGLVVTCSALKRSYRDVLRAGASPAPLRFIYLHGTRAVIGERIAARRGHFMPLALLDSQFEALEEPTPDENAWACDVSKSSKEIVGALVERASEPSE
jgi:gluconokinase